MIPEDDIQTTHAPEESNQTTVPPHPLRHLSNRPEPNSVIYDKSDHPNSPELHHFLFHGVRIYDHISPDPHLSNPPIFDSTIGPSSAPDIPLRLSPLLFTPLTSPVKSNDSGLGFLCHAATPNAFAATTSTSPPVIGRPTSAEESQGYDDGVIDLTQTKDLPRHVPSMEENHLANELFRYPLIPAIALITPLPQMEWNLFKNILKANINVTKAMDNNLCKSRFLILISCSQGYFRTHGHFSPANGIACSHALGKTLRHSTEGTCSLRPTHSSKTVSGELCRFQQV
ncbi:hypothetical protein F2Q69_00050259 [Brassica cretica]|uniref:Uncharacterized protein n=1 Tax=Brassica cretica TaxID=69181 RepID=A0A8S9PSE3_BRACR|nr:hypothetical protein F2Q69_00050259 [Brassica cretica]